MERLEEIKVQLDKLDEEIIGIIDRKRELSKLISQSKYDEISSGFICKEYMEVDIKKVVYQGVEGAYSHIVTKKLFSDVKMENVNTFEDAINEVYNGDASYCVIPIENSSAGIVTDVFDLFLKKDVVIVAFRC